MDDRVKRRRYDATRRRERSDGTRRRIFEAARELMLTGGYRATTVGDIAERAGVNADTVYQLAGRKPAILRELIEQAISAADRAVPAEERDYVLAIRAEPDPAAKLTIYARSVRRIQERLAPVLRVVREAGPSEPEVAAVWNEIATRRADNMKLFVADVARAGPLREGVTIAQAADTVWVLNSSEVYLLLTGERGWTADQFESWVGDTWRRLLLP